VGGFLIGCTAGLIFFLVFPRTYGSTAQILVMLKDSNLPVRGVEGEVSETGPDRVSEDMLATHMQIVASRRIVGEALKRYHYDELPSIVDYLRSDQTPIEFVIERLEVTRGGEDTQAETGHVLTVEFRHSSDTETQQILDAIVTRYREFLLDEFQFVNREAFELIAKARGELADDLAKAKEEYRRFREKAPLLWNGKESSNVYRTRYEALESALTDVQRQAATTRVRLDMVRQATSNLDAGGAIGIERLAVLDGNDLDRLKLMVDVVQGDSNTIAFQLDQPVRLEAARAENESVLNLVVREQAMLADLGPKHPDVKYAHDQVTAAREFLRALGAQLGEAQKPSKLTIESIVRAYEELLRQDLAALNAREAWLKEASAKEHNAAKELVVYELKDEAIREEVDQKRSLYNTALEHLHEINLIKSYGGFANEVIAPVELGERVFPRGSWSLLIGAALGLIVGSAGAVVAEAKDQAIQSIDELGGLRKLPVIGVVPRFGTGASRDKSRQSLGGPATVVIQHQPHSREAEAFRGMRTSLSFHARRFGNVIVVTSAAVGDGKSTMAANLAVSLAQAKRTVLLVDADLRRPRQHMLFEIENVLGLSTLLSGNAVASDCIRAGVVERLSILPSGPVASQPAELFGSPEFAELLSNARERYDFVLLDCPAALAVADPCIIAPQADAVVLVTSLGHSSRLEIMHTAERLESVGARLLGWVVNDIHSDRAAYPAYDSYRVKPGGTTGQ
jgi:polysaccharide biosynthesis transport protein